jgi:hypothetical protein
MMMMIVHTTETCSSSVLFFDPNKGYANAYTGSYYNVVPNNRHTRGFGQVPTLSSTLTGTYPVGNHRNTAAFAHHVCVCG